MNVVVSEQQVVEVVLPMELFQQLSDEAERTQQAATQLARLAIEKWLKQRHEEFIEAEIAAYAEEYAGTEFDVDKDLVDASVELLCSDPEELWPSPSFEGK